MSPSLPFHSPLTHFMATARRLSSYYSGGNCSGRVSLLSWRLSTGTLQTVQVCLHVLLCWGKGKRVTFDLSFLSRFYLDKYREIGSPSSVRLCCGYQRIIFHTHTCTHTYRQSLRALWSWFSWRSGYMEEWLQSSSVRTSLTLCLTSSMWVVSMMDGVHMYRVIISLFSPPSSEIYQGLLS